MNIEYIDDLPDIDSFCKLYRTTGWNDKVTKEKLFGAIINTWYSVSAYSESELVGFGRIISDGGLHAFIIDLMIDPRYQGKGIGTKILRKLVDTAINKGIDDIQLFCAQEKKGFYLKNGFEERSSDAPGMQYII